jgi:hypothetical protein
MSVSGSDLSGLALRLQPGLSISGRVAFDGTAAPPSDLTRIRVSLGPAQNGGTSVLLGDPQMNADGTFTFQGATPGRYRVGATVPQTQTGVASGAPAGTTTPTWWLKSVVHNGVDTLDSALEISNADLSGIVITFIDRPTNLSGRLLDAAAARPLTTGWSRSDESRIVGPGSRIRTRRTSTASLIRPPPGDYGLVALTDLDQADLSDPAFPSSSPRRRSRSRWPRARRRNRISSRAGRLIARRARPFSRRSPVLPSRSRRQPNRGQASSATDRSSVRLPMP